ncbi:unnamed protein product [Schistocephalus solidus]|uniref:Uncharacterized protein n=1 Tax=Schistocephalus solidus TaxID=70667 RepID=A0A183TB45_SCHSO|nr:unnamed protein product [Schistocephalus solidus]
MFCMRSKAWLALAIHDADGGTDHRLVISKMSLDFNSADGPNVSDRQDLYAPEDTPTVDLRWCQLRNVIRSTVLEFLGRVRRQHQDWFEDDDADIRNLLVEKNRLHKVYIDLQTDAAKATFFRCRRLVQQRLCEIQATWMVHKAEEIQGYADCNEMKNFFKAIKAIYGPRIKRTAPLLSSDGIALLTEKSQILKYWAEHFRMDTNNDLDLLPSLPEPIQAVQQISSGKAPGSDAIPPEVCKHSGLRLMAELTALFQERWRQGQAPQDFKDATIVHLYKRKGNRQLCRRLDDTPLPSGDLDRRLETNQEAESLPSQLPPKNTEAEMARQDPGHGSP